MPLPDYSPATPPFGDRFPRARSLSGSQFQPSVLVHFEELHGGPSHRSLSADLASVPGEMVRPIVQTRMEYGDAEIHAHCDADFTVAYIKRALGHLHRAHFSGIERSGARS